MVIIKGANDYFTYISSYIWLLMDQLNLSSEDRLLLYCARTSMNEDITHKVKGILNDCLDWDYIVESSMRHGISPLLYWNLSKIDNGGYAPAEVLAKLKKLYYGNAARNMYLYDELSKVLKAFKDAGIDVIVLKGAFLAEAVYKNIGLRPMSDVDLLIKKEDLSLVKKELAQVGYTTQQCDLTQWHAEQGRLLTHMHIPPYCKHGLSIEVHWDIQTLASPFRIDINTFWGHTQPVTIADVEVLMLAPEDLLQHLCLHLEQHRNSGSAPLRWYCDIAEVIKYHEGKFNWEYLVKSAKNHGIEVPMYKSLYIVTKYLGTFVPTHVLNDFKPTNVDCDDLFRRSIEGNLKKEKEGLGYFRMLIKVDGIGNKAHLLLGAVFPCKEYMMRYYSIKNKKLIYVYYLFRFGTALHCGINVLGQLLLYPFKFKLKSKKA